MLRGMEKYVPYSYHMSFNHSYSDYCPILLELNGCIQRCLSEQPFRFQAAWLLHKEFPSWVEKEWVRSGDLPQSLKHFLEKPEAWNRVVFGSIHKRKRWLRGRLDGIMRALDTAPTVSLIKLKRRLKKQWMEVLMQEEIMWMQRSRVDWLRFGDCNTKFFHTTTLVKRRCNKILMLKDSEGAWIEDAVRLKKKAVDYYSQLFKSEGRGEAGFIRGEFPRIEASTVDALEVECTEDEVLRALRKMGPYKAPGLDGY